MELMAAANPYISLTSGNGNFAFENQNFAECYAPTQLPQNELPLPEFVNGYSQPLQHTNLQENSPVHQRAALACESSEKCPTCHNCEKHNFKCIYGDQKYVF